MNQTMEAKGHGDPQLTARRLVLAQDYMVLSAAFIAFLFSVTLWFTGNEGAGTFVGLWVPSILAFGIYSKLMLEVAKND